MGEILLSHISDVWTRYFEGEPVLVRSPGRINLIGEHTDYNEGYVFPAAINRSIVAAIQPSGSPGCRVISLDTNRELEFSLTDPPFRFSHGSWENYVIGVTAELLEDGYDIGGFKMIFSGDIPQGAGLSSSAALENAVVFGLNEIFELKIPKEEMILIAQRAEQNHAGVQCGIMDQYASMFGKSGHALLLDCRSIRSINKKLDLDDCELLLVNSNVKHALAESAYNDRREECQTGVAIIQEVYPDLRSLRDISMIQLEQIQELFPPLIYDRCAYVVKENARVLQAVLALEAGDMKTFGSVLFEAHSDMRYLYEITCPEIDYLVDAVGDHPNLLGCRMMGGGFGGCTINLIRKGCAEDIFSNELQLAYKKRFQRDFDLYYVETSDGTTMME